MTPPSALWHLAVPCLLATELSAQQGRTAAAGEELERSSWFADVSAGLQAAEYRFAPVQGEEETWWAPSRAQDFRSRVSAAGLEVVPRDAGETGPAWRLVLATRSFGRAGHALELGPATVQVAEERAELDHGRLTEWFVNDERGLEQGWTIASAPFGVEPLWIGLAIDGDLELRIDEGGRSGRFVDAAGELRLRYSGLMAFDATGRELEARLAPGPEGAGIWIDDAGAVYPLTVDPTLTGPAWTAESDQASAYLGYAVASAGDVDGDGYGDVIVGAWGYDNGQASEGRAFVYLGSSAGLSTSAAWTAESDQANSLFGIFVSTAGDVNGDGYDDVLVGAPQFGNGQADEGRAFLYLGSSSGPAAGAAWTAESDQGGAYFGYPVAAAGDVNGDGYDDVLVGCHLYDGGETDEGRAFLYLGSGAGLAASAAWTAESDQDGAWLGYSVASAGDVNGDGYDDVIAGARDYGNEGAAFLYLGSGAGLATSAAWSAESDQSNAEFGVSVSSAGDVNGDGYSDVIVGSWTYDNGNANEGRAFLYLGSGAGLAASAAWTAESDQLEARLGFSVAQAGDVNGDGYSDVLVGAYQFDNGQTNEGRALLYLGSGAGLSASADWTAEADQASANFGICVATAGDVNGDGYSDVLVGAYAYDNGQADEGRAYVYLGSGAGLSASAAWTAERNQAGAQFGFSVATAGDVNADGYSDVIVGAFLYDRGQTDEGRAFLYLGSGAGLSASAAWTAEGDQSFSAFGYSVAGAGDVNGDGYGDVVVGSPYHRNGQVNEGRAFLYLGSAAGLATGAAWTAESDQVSALFGTCVAPAGDVNGDGYWDVIVGSRLYDDGETDEGGAFLYLGSGAGLSTSAAWTAEGDQEDAWFGYSVATAGDVNGDGYSDVIVGAWLEDNGETDEGRAFAYLGSGAGLSTSAAWTAEGDQVNAYFGYCVATAGDVNGDGYSDVIVGADGYDGGQTDEGRALVYLGSGAGLATSAAWAAESDQDGAHSGASVATAGDVNGDGYSDVIVGAWLYDNGLTDEGRAFVHLGSGAGLSSSAAWTAESDQDGAQFGFCAATAGDVNGDGYSDVIVGARWYDSGQTDEGRAFLYLGNEGRGGRVLAPQQRRLFAPEPIAPLGLSHATGFRIQVEHPALAGGGRAFLEWEVEPLGVPFGGTGLGRSALGQPVDPFSALFFDEVALPLDDPTLPYKWRARVVLEGNRFFPSTPWFGIPDNARTETDLRFRSRFIRPADGGSLPLRTVTVP